MSHETSTAPRNNGTWGRRIAGGLALLFGAATVIEGGRTLFAGPAADVVEFVLVFNVAAGLAYLLAGGATLAGRPWAVWVARALAASTLLVFAAFAIYAAAGGAHQTRTFGAMTLRSGFWLTQALVLPRLLGLTRPLAPAHN